MKCPRSKLPSRPRILAVLFLLAIPTSASPAPHQPPRSRDRRSTPTSSAWGPLLAAARGEFKQKQEQELPSSNEEGWSRGRGTGVVKDAPLSPGVVNDAAVSSQAAAANESPITVVKSKMSFDFDPQVQFVLPLSNNTNKQFHAKVEMQFLDNENNVAACPIQIDYVHLPESYRG